MSKKLYNADNFFSPQLKYNMKILMFYILWREKLLKESMDRSGCQNGVKIEKNKIVYPNSWGVLVYLKMGV